MTVYVNKEVSGKRKRDRGRQGRGRVSVTLRLVADTSQELHTAALELDCRGATFVGDCYELSEHCYEKAIEEFGIEEVNDEESARIRKEMMERKFNNKPSE